MEKIEKIEVVIKEDLNENERSIVELYWKMENNHFVSKPSNIAKKLKLPIAEIQRLVRENSVTNIIGTCFNCKQTVKVSVNNLTRVKKVIGPLWECDECNIAKIILRKKKEYEIKDRILKFRTKKFQFAIKNRTWENFNKIELSIILDFLKVEDYNTALWKVICDDKKKWNLLDKCNNAGLLDIVKDDRNNISNIIYLDNLKNIIQAYLHVIQTSKNELISKSTKLAHPEIGFRMIKNKRRISEDDAIYYGDVTFDRDIIIKGNTPYAYSVWHWDNGDVWLSITPSDNILKSKNIPRSNGPKQIGDIIKKWKM